MKNEIVHSKGGTMFAGEQAVDVLAMITVAHGMKLYAKTGMKPNRAYTPTAMLKFASEKLGRKFKRTQMLEAAEALLAFAQAKRAMIEEKVVS
jgi:hypothetical protein